MSINVSIQAKDWSECVCVWCMYFTTPGVTRPNAAFRLQNAKEDEMRKREKTRQREEKMQKDEGRVRKQEGDGMLNQAGGTRRNAMQGVGGEKRSWG